MNEKKAILKVVDLFISYYSFLNAPTSAVEKFVLRLESLKTELLNDWKNESRLESFKTELFNDWKNESRIENETEDLLETIFAQEETIRRFQRWMKQQDNIIQNLHYEIEEQKKELKQNKEELCCLQECLQYGGKKK